MLTTRGTQALIELEDSSPDFLFSCLPGTNTFIWPYVRIPVSHSMAVVELAAGSVSPERTRRQEYGRIIRSYFPNAGSSRSLRAPREFCFFVGGGTTRITPSGTENWLVDRFAAAIPGDSIVVQDGPLSGHRRDRVNPETYSFDATLARVDVQTKLSPLHEKGKYAVHTVVKEAVAALDFNLDKEVVEKLASSAAYQLGRVAHLVKHYERLLDRLQPRLVFLESASYSGRSSLISLMKDRGIRVIEPQHGWIGPSHAAYNFGAAMSSPELLKTLPDVVMTFGDFWSERIRHPADVVSIGKPHMDEMSRELTELKDRAREVLVVSSVAEPDKTADFVLSLRDALPTGWTVVFRPHPSEKATAFERYPLLVDAQRVSFDSNSDVYTSLRSVRGVVGYASTVLYEAAAMGCHIFAINSPFAPYYIDELFGELIDERDGADRIAAKLLDGQALGIPNKVRDHIWKPAAEKNFADFVFRIS